MTTKPIFPDTAGLNKSQEMLDTMISELKVFECLSTYQSSEIARLIAILNSISEEMKQHLKAARDYQETDND